MCLVSHSYSCPEFQNRYHQLKSGSSFVLTLVTCSRFEGKSVLSDDTTVKMGKEKKRNMELWFLAISGKNSLPNIWIIIFFK